MSLNTRREGLCGESWGEIPIILEILRSWLGYQPMVGKKTFLYKRTQTLYESFYVFFNLNVLWKLKIHTYTHTVNNVLEANIDLYHFNG